MLDEMPELISDLLLWTPTPGRTRVCRLSNNYINQLFVDTEYSLDLLREKIKRDE